MKTFLNLFATAFVFTFIFSPVARAATKLAEINSTVITLEEFNKKYRERLKFFRYKAPTKKNVLDELVNREIGISEAKRLKLDKDPEVIEKINTVLFNSLLDKTLATKFDEIDVTDSEVDSYYSRNPEIRTSHVFVQLRFDANAKQQKAAFDKIKSLQDKLNETLKAGKKTFAEFARENSEGVAATTGGDIDYQTKDKLDPTYYETAVNLKKVGAVSDVVRSQFGYHIIMLTGIKDLKDVDKGHYKRIIFDEKRTKIYEAYMDQLKKKSKVVVNSALIK